MEFALNFMKSNLGIDSPALLSSPFILITLAFFGHRREYQISPQEAGLLRYWVLLANAKGRYSRGSSETILDQDLAILREGGVTGRHRYQHARQEWRRQIGRNEAIEDMLPCSLGASPYCKSASRPRFKRSDKMNLETPPLSRAR